MVWCGSCFGRSCGACGRRFPVSTTVSLFFLQDYRFCMLFWLFWLFSRVPVLLNSTDTVLSVYEVNFVSILLQPARTQNHKREDEVYGSTKTVGIAQGLFPSRLIREDSLCVGALWDRSKPSWGGVHPQWFNQEDRPVDAELAVLGSNSYQICPLRGSSFRWLVYDRLLFSNTILGISEKSLNTQQHRLERCNNQHTTSWATGPVQMMKTLK